VTSTGGNDIVLADNGVIARNNGLADANDIYSTDTTLGGNDIVSLGSGDDIVIGGYGDDQILSSGGNNLIGGDSLYITRDSGDVVQKIATIDPATGGIDNITTGSGKDSILGGAGGDSINAGDGANIVIGDDGIIARADGLAD